MSPEDLHEPTADERRLHQLLRVHAYLAAKGAPSIRSEEWREVDRLLDELNEIGRVAIWPLCDDMGTYMEREP